MFDLFAIKLVDNVNRCAAFYQEGLQGSVHGGDACSCCCGEAPRRGGLGALSARFPQKHFFSVFIHTQQVLLHAVALLSCGGVALWCGVVWCGVV